MRRRLLHLSSFSLLGAALIHCSADGTATQEDIDAGGPPADGGSPPTDAGDASLDDAAAPVEDAGQCSADQWCRTVLPEPDLQLTAVWGFAADDAIASSTGALFHWNGAAWTAVDAAGTEGITGLWASSPNDVWGISELNRRLVHGTRAGGGAPFTWTKLEYDVETTPTLDILRGRGDSELWIYGQLSGEHVLQRGTIATANEADGGPVTTVSWTTLPIALDDLRNVSAFWVTPDSKVWIAGTIAMGFSETGVVIFGSPRNDDPDRYDWEKVLEGTVAEPLRVSTVWSEGAELWAIATAGEHYRGASDGDGGVGWTTVPSNTKTTMRSIWGRGSNDIWLAGEGGAIRHWDGSKWSVARLSIGGIPMWNDLNAIHAGPAGDVWAVGRGVALHRLVGGAPFRGAPFRGAP